MRSLFTLALSLGLLTASGGTAWVFLSLSKNVEMSRVDPGAGADVRVP